MKPQNNKELWVTNISTKKDISIDDLRVTVRRCKSINLLDTNHFKFTEAELEASITKGSIFKKSHVLKIRRVVPIATKIVVEIDHQPRATAKIRNNVEVKIGQFDELDFDDESEYELASKEADLDFSDTAPIIAIDKKFGGNG